MNVTEQLEGLEASIATTSSIIPLTITEVLKWMDPEDQDLRKLSTDEDVQKIVGGIRRLESIGIDTQMTIMTDNNENTLLHWAAKYGHDDCIRKLLDIDPSMTKMVNNDGASALHL
eukprot:PhF_6_TR14401/c0_g1_i1/m.23005